MTFSVREYVLLLKSTVFIILSINPYNIISIILKVFISQEIYVTNKPICTFLSLKTFFFNYLTLCIVLDTYRKCWFALRTMEQDAMTCSNICLEWWKTCTIQYASLIKQVCMIILQVESEFARLTNTRLPMAIVVVIFCRTYYWNCLFP